jgi:spoIIIJ-associated protein
VPGLEFSRDLIVLPAPETLPPPGGFEMLPPGPWTLAAREILEEILRLMTFEAEGDAVRLAAGTLLTVRCPDSAIIIGRRGVGLDALETVLGSLLARRIPPGACEEARRVMVDAEDYRARRHLGLLQKTYVAASEALTARRPQSIPQLSAPERHLVRTALEPVAGVRTATVGAGALRNVAVIPDRDAG